MRLSLRAREVLAIAAVVALVVAVATAGHVLSVARITVRASADEGELLARQLFHQAARVVAGGRRPTAQLLGADSGIRALLEGMVGYSPVVVDAAIVDTAAVALVHSTPRLEGQPLPARPRLADLRDSGTWRLALTLLGRPHIYEVQLPMRIGDRPFGAVRVGVSTSLIRRELLQALLGGLALGAGAIAVAVAVGLGVGRVALRALRRIAAGMEAIARGRYDAALDLTRDDELGELAARVRELGERVQADRSQWQSDRARMEGALNSLEDAVVLLNGRRETVFCNQAAAAVLDRPRAALLGRPLAEALPPDHPLLAIVSETFEAGGEPSNRPVSVPGTDGRVRELAVSCAPILEGDQAGGAVLALRDLGPVRAVHSLVTYSQKLAALGRLTSGAAHEMKNPLNAMRIHLELLRTRLGPVRPEVQDNLDVIAAEILRLDRVVQGFLKFVRPQELRLGPVDVPGLLAEVAGLVAADAERSAVRVALDVPPRRLVVTGDPELLRQAVVNLATNAIQAMPHGGTVTLAAQAGTPGTVEVQVRDEGVGIPPEDLDRIFRLYYTTKAEGSGIGLALVYRIAQLHDGRIDVDSVVGRGTTMRLTLPTASVQAAA